ncbi:MAG TPA: hypothetical protein VFF73_12545, partial [Planctomycetota bacterium]|nr:hypothetical protein [Planctomycetota bacterium]
MRRAILLSLVLLAGCGEATWNDSLDTSAQLAPGMPFAEALKAQGCPDSVQEIDSETFTASWEKVKVKAFSLYTHRDHATYGFVVRKGRIGPSNVSAFGSSGGVGIGFGADAAGPLRSTGGKYGLIPLVCIIFAWEIGRKLKEHARHALLPLGLVSLLLLGTSWSSDKTGPSLEKETEEGSSVVELYKELGEPEKMTLTPDTQLLVYKVRETKHMVLGGSEAVTTQAYLVQRGKVIARTNRTPTL